MVMKIHTMVFWIVASWKQHGPTKYWYPTTSLCGMSTYMTMT